MTVSVLQPEDLQNKNISFTGKNIIQPSALKKFSFPNNVKLVINDTAYKIRTSTILKIESKAPSKAGTAQILAQILSNSTALHNEEEFAYLKAKEGVQDIGITPLVRGLSLRTQTIKETLTNALKIGKEMLFSTNINAENFEKAKNEVKLSLNSAQLSADARTIETMYGNHEEGISQRVVKNSIDSVTLEDVQEYYKELFENGTATASITGPISKLDGLKNSVLNEISTIEHVFSNKKKVMKPFELPKINQVVVQAEKERTQSHIVQLYHLDIKDAKDFASMSVLDSIIGSGGLNSRLFKDLREKQKLAYQAGSAFMNKGFFAQQKLVIKTGILSDGNVNDNIQKSLLGFEKHIKKITSTRVSELEIQNAKKTLINAYTEWAAEADGQNTLITRGMASNYGPQFFNQIVKELENVTAKDVQDIAKKYLTKPSVTSILTTEEAAKSAEEFLKTRGEYKFFGVGEE